LLPPPTIRYSIDGIGLLVVIELLAPDAGLVPVELEATTVNV
jgi:hypothetical protein